MVIILGWHLESLIALRDNVLVATYALLVSKLVRH